MFFFLIQYGYESYEGFNFSYIERRLRNFFNNKTETFEWKKKKDQPKEIRPVDRIVDLLFVKPWLKPI